MQRPQIDIQAPRRVRPQRVLWLILCWSVLAAMISMMIYAAMQETFAPPRILKGALKQETAHHNLTLRANIPVSEILVQNGDMLARGQAVLHYDTDVLQADLVELHTEMQHNLLVRQCLLAPQSAPHKMSDDPTPPAEHKVQDSSEMVKKSPLKAADILLQTALSQCKDQKTAHALAQRELELDITRLHHRLQSQRHSTPTPPAHLTGQDLISIQIAQDIAERSLLVEVEHHKIQLQKLISAQQRTITEQIHQMTTEYSALKTRSADLEALLNDPFLRSPQTGKLARQRNISPSSRFNMDIIVAQVISKKPDYTATSQIDERVAQTLRPGDIALFRLSGLPLSAPMIPAEISHIQPKTGHFAPSRQYQIQFRLRPQDIEDPHWRPRVTRYFSVMDGQANAEITLPASTLSDDMKRRFITTFRTARHTTPLQQPDSATAPSPWLPPARGPSGS